MMNSRKPFPLPDEIIEVILLNLLVQPILKFRCVCKSWCCLISSEKFIESHLQIYGKNAGRKIIFFNELVCPKTISHCPLYSSLIPGDVVEYDDFVSPVKNAYVEHLIFNNNNPCLSQRICNHHCPLCSPRASSMVEYDDVLSRLQRIHFNLGKDAVEYGDSVSPPNIRVAHFIIVGSCNGLICIRIYYKGSLGPDLRLWNPSTRKSKILQTCLSGLSGFCFDELSKDYKVVFQPFGFRSGVRTKVYSLKSNSWKFTRVSGNIIYDPKIDTSGIFANGKFHWLVGGKVVCFDLRKEVWVTVDFDTPLDSSSTLGVLGGRLCIQCNFPKDRQDIWMLKHQTWDKVLTIKYQSAITSAATILMLCDGPNDTILLMERKTKKYWNSFKSIMKVYDTILLMERKKYKYKIHGMEINDGDGLSFAALEFVQIHHESLVQLPVANPGFDY